MALRSLTGFDSNNQRIVSVADPSSATDAATKQYVDNTAAGLKWKQAVRVATTTNGTLATAYENGDTVDGVVLATGDRILLKNQTAGAENGIYVVAASGAPARASDADTATEIQNSIVAVTSGTVNADTAWQMVTDNVTLGTTALVWSPFGVGVYSAGTGLTLTGTTFTPDTSILVRKYAADCAATTNPQTFTHNLGTKDVTVAVRRASDDVLVLADVTAATTNTVSVDFGGAPTSAQYRVIVHA